MRTTTTVDLGDEIEGPKLKKWLKREAKKRHVKWTALIRILCIEAKTKTR